MKTKDKILDLYKKYRELISYLIFGGLTTLVSFVTYVVFARLFSFDVVTSNVISWVISVLFAYITNRAFVFRSNKNGFTAIIGEMCSFFASRLFSGIIETLIMYIFVDMIGYYDIAVKIVATVIVIVLNYILSKLFVFKKKK